MTTYCILCRAEIPVTRQRRGAATCRPECAREYRRQRRSERATRFCRLCGRPARKRSVNAPVLHPHSGVTKQGQDA